MSCERSIILCLQLEDTVDGGKIPLPNVHSRTLSLVLEYAGKHAEAGDTTEDSTEAQELADWDRVQRQWSPPIPC